MSARAYGVAAGVAVLAYVLFGTVPGSAQQMVAIPGVTIYPGDTISDGAIIDRPLRAAGVQIDAYRTKREDLVGKIARRTLLPGQLVPADGVREPFAVTQGQVVQIVFTSGALSIVGQGSPLQSAAVGDIVSVRNVETGIVISGRVMPDRTIAVDGR